MINKAGIDVPAFYHDLLILYLDKKSANSCFCAKINDCFDIFGNSIKSYKAMVHIFLYRAFTMKQFFSH